MQAVEKAMRDIDKFVELAVMQSTLRTRNVALSTIYADTKYATNNTLQNTNIEFYLDGLDKEGKIIINPVCPTAKSGNSYAQALDQGHKLVYFGKPTNRFVKGKHYVLPAIDAGIKEFESILDEVMR